MDVTYTVELLYSKGRTGNYYWRLKARNGRILAHSEKYKTKYHAKKIAIQLRADLSYGKAVVARYVEHI